MNQQTPVREVQLVLPRRDEAAVVPVQRSGGSATLWVSGVVLLALVATGVVIWRRLRNRDPLDLAFAAAAGRAGLNREERECVEAMGRDEIPPVAIVISDSAFERAAAERRTGVEEDPAIVNVRRKLRAIRS